MIENKEGLIAAKKLSDWDIIQLILDGDNQLLEILYDRYATKAYHKCLNITKDRDVAQDLLHDIMIKIFMNLSKFKGTSDFSFWVNSITYNYCMDYLKKKKKFRLDAYDTIAYEQVSTAKKELENKILKDLQLDQLEIIFKDLKENNKILLLMRYQDRMSIKQIAEILEIGESAVKMRLKRSRNLLAELLNNVQNGE